MKITLTGSTGNITKPLAEILIGAGHQVTIISSDAAKTKAIEKLGATAAIGSVTDAGFLTFAFTGADAVYIMIPPNYGAPDLRKFMNETGENFAAAIKGSGVKKAVVLSSVGAHLNEGTGPITGLHDLE
ncbi:MAG: NAD-dependent dehydratase, partial [Sphingobacteriales bacterium]